MAARRKEGQAKMKYWGFYASIELKAETIECAKKLDIGDSEYIRKAVEAYNKQFDSTHTKMLKEEFGLELHNGKFKEVQQPKPTVESILDEALKKKEKGIDFKEQLKPTISELKEKVKEMESPKMCKSFGKDGK